MPYNYEIKSNQLVSNKTQILIPNCGISQCRPVLSTIYFGGEGDR